jgi:hypothetical protein
MIERIVKIVQWICEIDVWSREKWKLNVEMGILISIVERIV